MVSTRSIAALLIAATLLAACGEDDEPQDPAGGPDEAPARVDGDWVVVAGEVDGAPVTLLDGYDVTMTVDGDELGGTAACNGYGGSVTVADGEFAVGELSWTEMGCEPAVMDLEQTFLRSLSVVDTAVVESGALVLTGPSVEWRFARIEPVPDAEIAGTTWVLDTVMAGGAATSSAIMPLATVRFAADGTLSGSTGCQLLEGDWSLADDGAALRIGSVALLDDPGAEPCTPDAAELGETIVNLLAIGVTAEVDGSRLTLTVADGDGLSFTAAS